MKRKSIVGSAIALGCSLLSADVGAGEPYSIQWSFIEENPQCETANLGKNDGVGFFDVNDTPIPTFQVPGAFRKNADGTESNLAEAGFDSVLLRAGENRISFSVQREGGDNSCVHSQNLVTLVSLPLGIEKPLFHVRRDGTAFKGVTNVSLSLMEINPPLARDIANLEAEIDAQRKWLISHASETDQLAAKLDLLLQLHSELTDLVKRPLDEIAEADLDAILKRYSSVVDDATRAALEQLIADLKKSIEDLQQELASLLDQFGQQADSVVDLLTADARESGFLPDDPSAYTFLTDDTPSVDVPDISALPGAFEEGNDPYAAYADAVLDALAQDVESGTVVLRADFISTVRAWRANQRAIEKALLARASVSQVETNAFLKAQNRVKDYLKQFMDPSDWFLQSPIPPDVRAHIDGILMQAFGELAEQMKEALNAMAPPEYDWDNSQLVENIRAFAGAMSAIGDGVAAYAQVMSTLVNGAVHIGLSFVPYVGPALDLCEAITGKMYCLPNGADLSQGDRVFSAIGFGIGSVMKPWGGVLNEGISPGGKAAAKSVLNLGEEFALALQKSRRMGYKTILRGAVTLKPINEFEAKAGLYLMQKEGRAMIGVGDDGVRKVLGIPMPVGGQPPGLASAPDFLTVTKGNKLALSEVKGGKSINIAEPREQLGNALKKLKERNLDGDVERVELIISKYDGGFSDPNFGIKDGYLFDKLHQKTVSLEGFPLVFIKIIQI